MALKSSMKPKSRSLHEDFHESRAVSRLRFRRVSSGEWPERKGKNGGGWERRVSRVQASKCRVSNASF